MIDAIVVKIRDGQVANRPIYVAMGINLDEEPLQPDRARTRLEADPERAHHPQRRPHHGRRLIEEPSRPLTHEIGQSRPLCRPAFGVRRRAWP
jgi:hypothetical protein